MSEIDELKGEIKYYHERYFTHCSSNDIDAAETCLSIIETYSRAIKFLEREKC